ncbi:MAG: hypothetical protein H7068_00390 [Pedobacter sp.]|nr:hypothetical protein [Chitinophagaceae bacterium]
MKKIFVSLLLIVSFASKAQSKKDKYIIALSTGPAQLRSQSFIWGWYARAGIKYNVTKKFTLQFTVDHGISSSYPKNLSIAPNSTIYGEDQFIQRYIGISKSDWFNDKTKSEYNSNSTLALSINYNMYFGASKRWILSPKLGLAYFNNYHFVTQIGTAYFTNDILTGGKVSYIVEVNKLIGFQYGVELAKKLKNGNNLFLEINGESDNGANQKSYTAFKMGVGYAITL